MAIIMPGERMRGCGIRRSSRKKKRTREFAGVNPF
jgi:hypothetical protein